MRRIPRRLALTAILSSGLLAAGLIPAIDADAATNSSYFYGYAGSGYVQVGNSKVTSNLTVQSSAGSYGAPASDPERTAHVAVTGLLDAGATTTNTVVAATSGGYHSVTSTASVANVSLLGGVITVDAVNSSASVADGAAGYTPATRASVAGIHITNVKIPATIPQNYSLTIPGVASVTLNYGASYADAAGSGAFSAGIVITLLKAYGSYGAGAQLVLSPSYAVSVPSNQPPTGHAVAGVAYGTKVSAAASSTVNVTSDPTANQAIPAPGTGGATQSASVDGVSVAPALSTGGVTTTINGVNQSSGASATTTAKVAAINLLGGLIKADAVSASATSTAPTGGTAASSGSSGLVNLVIAGQKIPVNAAPNTAITIAGIAKVVVNQQIRNGNGILVRGVDVTLTTAKYGLGVGAEIEVAVAYAATS